VNLFDKNMEQKGIKVMNIAIARTTNTKLGYEKGERYEILRMYDGKLDLYLDDKTITVPADGKEFEIIMNGSGDYYYIRKEKVDPDTQAENDTERELLHFFRLLNRRERFEASEHIKRMVNTRRACDAEFK